MERKERSKVESEAIDSARDVQVDLEQVNRQSTESPIRARTVRRIPVQVHGGELLPMTFDSIEQPASVLALGDTGASVNAMSLKLAKLLHLDIQKIDQSAQQVVRLANGRTVKACGEVETKLSFAKEYLPSSSRRVPSVGLTLSIWHEGIQLVCKFRIYQKLRPALILGTAFLDSTKTLSDAPRKISQPCFANIPAAPRMLYGCDIEKAKMQHRWRCMPSYCRYWCEREPSFRDFCAQRQAFG